jgi:hypothetical protein
MRIVVENPRANGKKIRATATKQTALIYTNRISRLDECQHLSGNDPVSFHVKLRVLVDLINPSNIITHYRLVNPALLQLDKTKN